ncbi:MAG: hypothetical protein OES79_03360 [Planctomycetota bacterium]|nr:hypothetical protein [Planctomycetota bacterium]
MDRSPEDIERRLVELAAQRSALQQVIVTKHEEFAALNVEEVFLRERLAAPRKAPRKQ